MTVTLTGSRAVKHWFPDAREPKGDWDYHSPSKFVDPVELSYRNLAEPRDIFIDSRLGAWKWGAIATPDELYTMKISHSFWEINGPGNWNKHAADIVFLSRKGCKFTRPLYDILLPIWKERYRKNPTDTTKSKADFFNDAVVRKYDHDSLHETVAYCDEPLYMSYLADGETVKSDWSKFEALAFDAQLKAVREEVYATALERKLIPGNYRGSPGAAYYWALRRTATSLFKGEWALFLLLNLDTLTRPDCNYMQRHLENRHKLRRLDNARERERESEGED